MTTAPDQTSAGAQGGLQLQPWRAVTAAAVSVGLLAGLAACSSGSKSYDSPNQLVGAYKSAGGSCTKQLPVPESMVGEGAHAVLCGPGVNMLLVFDTEGQRNRYLAQVLDGEQQDVVAGERWVAIGDKMADKAGTLGGEIKVKQS